MANIVKPEVVQALAWYRHNTSIEQIVVDIYGPDHHGGYLEEKEDTLNKQGLLYLYCYLDLHHQRKLTEAVEARYSDYFKEVEVA